MVWPQCPGATSGLGDKELCQLYFICTGLGPKTAVKDLLVSTKSELQLGFVPPVQYQQPCVPCWVLTSVLLQTDQWLANAKAEGHCGHSCQAGQAEPRG